MLPNYDDFLIKRFEQPDEVPPAPRLRRGRRRDWTIAEKIAAE
jgi:hypothetical protein